MVVTVDLHHHRAAEGLAAFDQDQRPGLNLPRRQVAEHRGIAVGDASEDPSLIRIQPYAGSDFSLFRANSQAVMLEDR